MSLPAGFLDALRSRVSDDSLSTDPNDLVTYGKDWTKVYTPAPSVVARPRTTAEVATILRACNDAGVAVVPTGGRPVLSGGALARNGELVLSLDRMRRMDPIDTLGNTVRVQAGAITAAVHEHCAPAGLSWPVDFASKGSSHVGGNISTNA